MEEPVLERKVHSVRTAVRELGMEPRRLRKLLVDAKTARPHLDRINARVSAKDFQDALSMSRSQFDLLRKEGHFRPAIEGGDHKPLSDVRAAHRHLESLLSGAEPIYVSMHAWMTSGRPRKASRPSPAPFSSVSRSAGFGGSGDTWTRMRLSAFSPGISIEVFARQCCRTRAAAMRLVSEGHVPSTEGRHLKANARQRFCHQTTSQLSMGGS
ncbi:hypothetical protein NHU_02375 [Rhodovulum sulfidophilum]|uniref:Uncharacterized protein n=1 Tax=Rhodovulum sulfidophilum TaxID=35806 RepID=A0A0D6B391_RHOSU|nr:hypothetical protein NHU_02375 [Rhodovulum sulfidophilum]